MDIAVDATTGLPRGGLTDVAAAVGTLLIDRATAEHCTPSSWALRYVSRVAAGCGATVTIPSFWALGYVSRVAASCGATVTIPSFWALRYVSSIAASCGAAVTIPSFWALRDVPRIAASCRATATIPSFRALGHVSRVAASCGAAGPSRRHPTTLFMRRRSVGVTGARSARCRNLAVTTPVVSADSVVAAAAVFSGAHLSASQNVGR